MKIAYFVSMKFGLETFIQREVELLSKLDAFIHLYPTKVNKEYMCENNSLSIINKNFFQLFINFIRNILCCPKITFYLIPKIFKYKLFIEYLLFLSWQTTLKNNDYDILHGSFGDRKFFIAYIANKYFKKKLTVSIHAHELFAQPNPEFFKIALNDCDAIHTISQKNKEILLSKYNVNPKKIFLIRLPIDTNFWKFNPKINVITVARYTPRKGWDDLIKAAKMLNDDYHFITIGFGDMNLKKLVMDSGVDHKFNILGKLNRLQIRSFLNMSDIFCLPSKFTKEEGSEGIPVSLMEAMSMGLPIITTDDGSIIELVDNYIVSQANPTQLARTIKSVGKEIIKLKRKKIFQQNRKIVESKHNLKNINKLYNFFKNVK